MLIWRTRKFFEEYQDLVFKTPSVQGSMRSTTYVDRTSSKEVILGVCARATYEMTKCMSKLLSPLDNGGNFELLSFLNNVGNPSNRALANGLSIY